MRLRPLLLSGALAAGLAIVLRARQPSRHESPVGATTRSRRNAAMAGLMTRRASDRAMTNARSVLAVDATRRRLRAELERREADDVMRSLGHMKGALMKLGQMASYLDEAMPEPMREALAQLRSDAPPMSGDLALSEIESSLGRPLEDLFSAMDPTPVAAASIGQVHRATTIEGREVAVKVQYPGIADAIAADLDNTEALASLLAMVFPGLDSRTLVEELRARLTEELDYHHEARSQASFADYYRHHPHIWVPDVVADLSTDRVLTTEFVKGEPFDTLYKRSKADRDHYGEVLYRFVFRSLNRQLVFNGDPHPGNYIIADDGRLAFIDFGLVKHFEPSEVDQFVQLIRAMIEGDPLRFRRTAERFQVLQPEAPFTDDEIYEWFTSYYELILESKEIQVSAEYTSALLRQTFDARANAILKYANVPPTFALIQRINLGVFTLLARLEATANWRDISEELWTFTDGPPSSPQGQAEATWLVAHPRELPVS